MTYDLRITGLANKDDLVREGAGAHRLYKFTLNTPPDSFWVLLLQQAGQRLSDVTVSGNANQTELWASARSDVPVKQVLGAAKQAVAQANVDANESNAQFRRAAAEKADAMRAFEQELKAPPPEERHQLAAELEQLSFDDEPAPAEVPASEAPADDASAADGGDVDTTTPQS